MSGLEIRKTAVIGAGTMGNGIAHILAMHGYSTIMTDINTEALERGLDTISKNLGRMKAREKIDEAVVASTLQNIRTTTSLTEAVAGSDIVIEAATEDELIKSEIFRTIDAAAQDRCILATNTSSISITKLAAITSRPEKVIGMHFFNPVPVMKLVEVIKGFSTSQEVSDAVMSLSRKLGKTPVEVNDFPGFVSNRILMPMINEAIFTLSEGVAGVAEIDEVMKLGMAHPMGPLLLADFIGLDVCLHIMKVLHDGFGQPKYAPALLLVKMVAAGQLGRKSGSGFYDYTADPRAPSVARNFV